MGLKIWKLLRLIRDVLTFLPFPGSPKPKVEFHPILLGDAAGNAVNVMIAGTSAFGDYQKDETLRALIPDPFNTVLLIFSGSDADRARKQVGLGPFA